MASKQLNSFHDAHATLEGMIHEGVSRLTTVELILNAANSAIKDMNNDKGVKDPMRAQLQSRLEDIKTQSIETGKQVAHKLDNEAHKRPWHFVGFAAVFSAIFGFFVGRKTKR